MSGSSTPPDSSRSRDGGSSPQRGVRRTFLMWLLLPLAIPHVRAHQPDSHGLGLEERIRLRRELRQAHRDRMRDAHSSPQLSEEALPTAKHEASAPRRALEHGGRTPEPGASSPVWHEGWGRRDRAGNHQGRMALSDEEREQLRRQLREQRAIRRGAARGSEGGSSFATPQP